MAFSMPLTQLKLAGRHSRVQVVVGLIWTTGHCLRLTEYDWTVHGEIEIVAAQHWYEVSVMPAGESALFGV